LLASASTSTACTTRWWPAPAEPGRWLRFRRSRSGLHVRRCSFVAAPLVRARVQLPLVEPVETVRASLAVRRLPQSWLPPFATLRVAHAGSREQPRNEAAPEAPTRPDTPRVDRGSVTAPG